MDLGPRSSAKTALNGNGGNLSNASQLVSTSRPIRSGMGVDQELAQAAAGVVADERDVVQIEGDQEVVDHLGDPGGDSAVRVVTGMVCEPSGQLGRMQRKPCSAKLFCHRSPEPVVDEDAVHEHHRRMRRSSGPRTR